MGCCALVALLHDQSVGTGNGNVTAKWCAQPCPANLFFLPMLMVSGFLHWEVSIISSHLGASASGMPLWAMMCRFSCQQSPPWTYEVGRSGLCLIIRTIDKYKPSNPEDGSVCFERVLEEVRGWEIVRCHSRIRSRTGGL